MIYILKIISKYIIDNIFKIRYGTFYYGVLQCNAIAIVIVIIIDMFPQYRSTHL